MTKMRKCTDVTIVSRSKSNFVSTLHRHFAELVGANMILSTAVLVDSHSKRSRGFGSELGAQGFSQL